MKRVVALVALLALLLGSIGGAAIFFSQMNFSDSAPERLDEEERGDVATPPEPDLAKYYSQVVAWQSCGSTFQCGWVTVPLDYAKPQGRTIKLLALKLPARTDDRIGSLVVNPGGPGAPGTQYAAAGTSVFGDRLLDHFDVVGFDPRGTGSSRPVDCLSDEELDDYLGGNPTPRTPAEVAETDRQNRAFFEGCREKSGQLVDHVSTIEAARDMDVLRAVLGEGRLDYFGASYGTQLGATYAELFPERVGHFVLDGGVDVSADQVERSLVQARGFETALRAYVADCVEKSSCPLEGSVEEGLAQVTELVEGLAEKPLPAGGDRPLTPGRAFYGIVMPLYNRDYWSLLTSGLQKAFDGDGSGLLLTADLYASRGPDGFQDNSTEAIVAINCLDDPSFVPLDEVPERFDEFEEASPTFGRVFAWGLAGCEHFTGEPAEQIEIDGDGAAPIVVTGTTRDPATPLSWAEALADQLESGVLIRRDGDGHTAYNAGNRCVDDAVEAYLLDGTVPDDGLSC
ncbi:alpha/beta fold hydrolase [Nocardioides sp. Y6]|uniref:Alpha/beta fold hydrolase n=1 Tax=Nocardioides malaquae TaxID=2773426 RepID=A0ABR9RWD0_9ACTN|nr:alpha/beta hydrolase [Nocardioides malaquae]MBE7325472.1 alpha/beta fold hydrolase [Nocardioides malaquae]